MDYSQFLHMREELSLIAVLLLLFLADLFMSPDAHKNGGKARLNTMLPVILMAIHTAINLIPGTAADASGNRISSSSLGEPGVGRKSKDASGVSL